MQEVRDVSASSSVGTASRRAVPSGTSMSTAGVHRPLVEQRAQEDPPVEDVLEAPRRRSRSPPVKNPIGVRTSLTRSVKPRRRARRSRRRRRCRGDLDATVVEAQRPCRGRRPRRRAVRARARWRRAGEVGERLDACGKGAWSKNVAASTATTSSLVLLLRSTDMGPWCHGWFRRGGDRRLGTPVGCRTKIAHPRGEQVPVHDPGEPTMTIDIDHLFRLDGRTAIVTGGDQGHRPRHRRGVRRRRRPRRGGQPQGRRLRGHRRAPDRPRPRRHRRAHQPRLDRRRAAPRGGHHRSLRRGSTSS